MSVSQTPVMLHQKTFAAGISGLILYMLTKLNKIKMINKYLFTIIGKELNLGVKLENNNCSKTQY